MTATNQNGLNRGRPCMRCSAAPISARSTPNADCEPCLINPQDAAARGVADGDVLRIFDDRGQVLAGARMTNALRPGVIRVNEGGWRDPVEPREPGSLEAYAAVNRLPVDIGGLKLAQANCVHTPLADVDKYQVDRPELKLLRTPANA